MKKATFHEEEQDHEDREPNALLDRTTLEHARPENVERLARALGVAILPLRDPWARHSVLCRDVADAIAARAAR